MGRSKFTALKFPRHCPFVLMVKVRLWELKEVRKWIILLCNRKESGAFGINFEFC
jgi:hypothetical protein